MNTVALLFVVGVVFLAADVFVASFVMAAVGTLAMAAGCVAAFQAWGTMGAVIAAVAAAALLASALYLELVVLPRTRVGRGLIVHSVQQATSQPPIADPAAVVGLDAVAETTLAPSGYVTAGGRRYEAWCESGHVPRGAALRVLRVDNFRLIVTKT